MIENWKKKDSCEQVRFKATVILYLKTRIVNEMLS